VPTPRRGAIPSDASPDTVPELGRLLKNVGSLAGAQSLVKLLYFLLLAIVARLLPEAGFGRISYALLYAGFFAFLYDFGIATIVVRDLSGVPHGRLNTVFSRALGTRLMQTAVAVLVMSVSGAILGFQGRELSVLVLLCIGVVLTNLAEFMHLPFTAHDRIDRSAALLAAERLIVVVCSITALVVGRTELAFATGYVGGSVGAVVLAALVLSRDIGWIRIRPPARLLWQEALPIGLNMFFAMFYNRAGVLLVEYLYGAEAVAQYNSAFLFLFLLQVSAGALMISLFPSMSRLNQVSVPRLRRLYSRISLGILLVVVPVIALGAILARPLLIVGFGREYAAADGILKILFWTAGLFVFNTLAGHVFRATGRQRIMAWITFFGASLSVILYLMMVEALYLTGVALALLITEGIITLVCTATLVREFGGFSNPAYHAGLLLTALLTGWVTLTGRVILLLPLGCVYAVAWLAALIVLRRRNEERT